VYFVAWRLYTSKSPIVPLRRADDVGLIRWHISNTDYVFSSLVLLVAYTSMPSPDSESPEDGFFNDLTQQVQEPNDANGVDAQNDNSAKVKRIACVLCRKRKLRCDGTRPTCSTCKRLSHDCAYDEVRKKSGPKRGYVKLLEQRLRKSKGSRFFAASN
jgi:hypothetical protein